jgi:hypothetical protein
MHIYTPPGYEKGEGQFPVLYLLHGASDSDASWSTVGRAGFILDNLIAAGNAKPMIVVMPAGHTGPFRFGGPRDRSFERLMDRFGEDFTKDVRPFVEKNYRVLADRSHRAIAGLSMGGAQTLSIGFSHLDDYGYIGVFSSGVFGIAGGFGGAPPSTQWEDRHKATLDNAAFKQGLCLVCSAAARRTFSQRPRTQPWTCSRSTDSTWSLANRPAVTPGSTGATTCTSSRRFYSLRSEVASTPNLTGIQLE